MNHPTTPTLDDPENLSENAARVWESSTNKAVAGEAAHAWDSTKEKASEALHSSERYVREHLAPSVLGVFGAGMLVGALLAWSAAQNERRNDPSDSIHRLLARLGRKLNLD
jgi:ElaB/YqjD/DUF883 family membrane-anchored ribosome-binding protein